MQLSDRDPLIPASKTLPELTFRAIVISIILAVVLAAANAYLALKIGTTISASIPASVLALGILRFWRNSNVLESNIIQTAASAGEGIAAAVSFVLPAMLVLHIWKGFPYWESTVITLFGGLLGVLFSIPLRRVLLDMPTLRFPEGTAIGNVLRMSTKGGKSLKCLIQGASVGGLISFFQSGLQIFSDNVQLWFSTTRSIFGMGFGLTPAIFAAGYIVGPEVALSIFIGVVVGWVVLLPALSMHFASSGATAYDHAMDLWSNHLRFVGVGTMLVGGLWTMIRLVKPIISGLSASFQTFRQRSASHVIERTNHDIPIFWVVLGIVFFSICVLGCVMYVIEHMQMFPNLSYAWLLGIATMIYVVAIGFLLSAICGYFTGLVGSTNNPLSGILIIAIILLSLIYLGLLSITDGTEMLAVTGLVIIVATIMATVASIANENIQDLKAGQMVGATPWKQQVMLAIGVVVSALIIGPVLELLFNAYGMAGIYPRAGMDPTQMLAAPQASLMAAVAKGVLTHQLEWSMIFLGMGVAVLIILVDELLWRPRNRRLPALAVGLGIYLPPEVMTPVVIGGFISYLVKRARTAKNKSEANHDTVLLACGMVAGSALMGVILAIPFSLMGSSDALAIMPARFATLAGVLGVVVFLGLCAWIYRHGKSDPAN